MVESPTYYSRLFLSWLKDLLKEMKFKVDKRPPKWYYSRVRISAVDIILPVWRNWQTHMTQNHAERSVPVRVRPPA